MPRPNKHRRCKSLAENLDNQNSGSPTTTTSNLTILDLPPEMLEKVLEKLKTRDLLKCRLVKRDWKVSSNKVLERNALSLFTKWNIIQNWYDPFDLRIPNLKVNMSMPKYSAQIRELLFGSGEKQIQYSKMECPKGFDKDNNCPEKNPFPSNSLHLMIEICAPSRRRQKVEIYPFFASYGKFLTNLILFGYRTGTQEFSAFLSSLPNLKSLTLEVVNIILGPTSNELPPLPCLTHLRISSRGANSKLSLMMDEDALLWIIGKYSAQLVGLSIFGYGYLTLDEQGNIEHLRGRSFPFGNLQQLTINSKNKAFLKLTETANLTHLHITSDFDACVDGAVKNLEKNEATLETLFPLIQRFSQSLIYLRLPNIIGNVEQPRDPQPIRFPSLKTLGIRAPANQAELMIMSTIILPAFQAVKKLELIHYFPGNTIDAIWSEEFWRRHCPNLQVLSVYSVHLTGVEIPDHYRRKVIWSLAQHGR